MTVPAPNSEPVWSPSRLQSDLPLLVPLILCLFIFISSVMVVFSEQSVLNSKRLFQIGIIPVLFLAAIMHPALRTTFSGLIMQTPKSIRILLVFFFLLGIGSSLRFSHPAYSLVDVGLLFSLVLLIYVVASVCVLTGSRFDRLCLIFISVLGAAVMLQESMGVLANRAIGREFSYDSMFIYFSHPRFYNQLQTWSIPLIAALPFIFPGNRKTVIIAILLLAAHWYLLLASGARGSIVGLTMAIVFTSIFAFRIGKKWIALQIGGALSGLIVFYGVYLAQRQPSTSGGGQFVAESVGRDMTHLMGRNTFWKYAWNDAVQNPWLGAGPGRFACNADIALPAHPHNMVMQLLSEWGFPATVLIVMVIIYLGWHLVRRLYKFARAGESNPNVLKLSLATALIAAAIHSGVSGLLVMPASTMMATIVGGWLLGLTYTPTQASSKTTLSNTFLVAGLAISIAVSTFGFLEIKQLDHRMQGFGKTERQMPRFWSEGRICRYTY